MFSITMRHTGELFLETPESKYALNKKLVLQSSGHISPENVALFALRHDLIEIVLTYFGVSFDDLIGCVSTSNRVFPAHIMRTRLLNEIEMSVLECITPQLENRNITSYSIVDC